VILGNRAVMAILT